MDVEQYKEIKNKCQDSLCKEELAFIDSYMDRLVNRDGARFRTKYDIAIEIGKLAYQIAKGNISI